MNDDCSRAAASELDSLDATASESQLPKLNRAVARMATSISVAIVSSAIVPKWYGL